MFTGDGKRFRRAVCALLLRTGTIAGAVAFIILLALAGAGDIWAQPEDSEKALESSLDESDSLKLLIPLPFFSKIGFQAGIVSTDVFDPGVDFGVLVAKDLYRDFFEFTTVVHLWGATNDTLDVANAGIDANLLYKIPVRWGFLCFGGFVVSANYVHREQTTLVNGESVVSGKSEYVFESFVTAGMEYDIKANRTLFLQLKYGDTGLARETHLIAGINFYTKYKKFIPWLAPPLMRD